MPQRRADARRPAARRADARQADAAPGARRLAPARTPVHQGLSGLGRAGPQGDLAMIDELEVTFGGGRRDRADRLRGDADALARLSEAPDSRVLPLWRGKPLFDLSGPSPALGWLPLDAPILSESRETPVFLGLEGDGADAAGRFAADVSAWVDPENPDGPPPGFRDATRNAHPSLPEASKFVDLRSIMGELTTQDAADAATARGVLEWHRTHPHCSRCGTASLIDGAGWRRRCPSCGAMHFPRTDPVVIMLVTDGDRCLLGRQPPWPPTMYSLLAGFMEPGETLEEATRREVSEESSVPVGRVRYLCSQPWPFPASLMIATHGEALDDRIEIDPNELEDARWATRDELREALAGRNPDIGPARPGAVARTVIEAWVEGRVPDFD